MSTGYFIKKHDLADTFKIAAILARDEEDFVNKGSGWMLRAAGEANRDELLKFLEDHAAAMPRTLLRYATEKLDKERREFYLNLKKDKRS